MCISGKEHGSAERMKALGHLGVGGGVTVLSCSARGQGVGVGESSGR